MEKTLSERIQRIYDFIGVRIPPSEIKTLDKCEVILKHSEDYKEQKNESKRGTNR